MDNLNLNELRKEINRVDTGLTRLLERRFDLVMMVADYKKANDMDIYDSEREGRVIENCKSCLKDPRYAKHIEKLYHEIMDAAKDMEQEQIREA